MHVLYEVLIFFNSFFFVTDLRLF